MGKLSGSDHVVVRDITDITHPKTLSAGDIPWIRSRFVSGTELSYVDQGGNLMRRAFSSSSGLEVARCVGEFDWKSDGTAVVYVTPGDSGTALHQLSADRDIGLASLPATPAIGCESQTCVDAWDFRLIYSPDGADISLVTNIGKLVFRLWASDGTLIKSMDSQQTTMSAWSGKGLYFRDDKGVEMWRNGAISAFLPGVAWIRPKASPGGGQIVYAARDSTGLAHTYIVDTSTGKVRDLGKARAEPAFLTPSLIWYQGERSCIASDQCGGNRTVPTGKTYIYDLQDGTETESRITFVADVWPHPA
ncbi:MAG TPA: hypothetical protein VGS16_12760 [Candidatus Dormibacteraeota bacterium]|nr:hypothetical protein [Candidatus Dormibacteraeota bacterium]